MRTSVLLSAVLFAGILLLTTCSDDSPIEASPANASLSGILFDEQTHIVPNAIIEVQLPNGTSFGSDTTSEDGAFTLLVSESGLSSVQLVISHSDFKTYRQDMSTVLQNGSATDLTIVMEHRDSACGKISLLVRTSDSLNPLESAEIRLTRNGTLVTKAFSDMDGRVSFDYLIAGAYGLRIAKQGYKVVEKTFTISHCDTASFDIRLEDGSGNTEDSCCNGVLELIVVDGATNLPIVNAILKMWKNGAVVKDGKTNENGVIRLSDICKGTYGFDLLREGYSAKEFSITFGCSEIKTDTIFMTATGTGEDSCCHGILSLTVTNNTTQSPIQNVTVKLWKNASVIETGKTNAQGVVLFDGICEGNYAISTSREGYAEKEAAFQFGCNEQKSESIALTPTNDSCCTASLKLRILDDASGSVIPGATVTVTGPETQSNGTSNAEGWFLLEAMCAPATYTVTVTANSYTTKSFSFTYSECKRIQETVRLVIQ